MATAISYSVSQNGIITLVNLTKKVATFNIHRKRFFLIRMWFGQIPNCRSFCSTFINYLFAVLIIFTWFDSCFNWAAKFKTEKDILLYVEVYDIIHSEVLPDHSRAKLNIFRNHQVWCWSRNLIMLKALLYNDRCIIIARVRFDIKSFM